MGGGVQVGEGAEEPVMMMMMMQRGAPTDCPHRLPPLRLPLVGGEGREDGSRSCRVPAGGAAEGRGDAVCALQDCLGRSGGGRGAEDAIGELCQTAVDETDDDR